MTALAGVLSLVLAAPLGPPPVAGEELTKPPWVFIWLYPFENWWGVKSLLWIPVGIGVVLFLVPLVDRFSTNSRQRVLLVVGATVIVMAALVALGIYAWRTTPAEHLVE
jgi:quinol-cytochrome oxidoreductase complex cytochrome b subunit